MRTLISREELIFIPNTAVLGVGPTIFVMKNSDSTSTIITTNPNTIPDAFVKISIWQCTEAMEGNFKINPCLASYIPAHCSPNINVLVFIWFKNFKKIIILERVALQRFLRFCRSHYGTSTFLWYLRRIRPARHRRLSEASHVWRRPSAFSTSWQPGGRTTILWYMWRYVFVQFSTEIRNLMCFWNCSISHGLILYRSDPELKPNQSNYNILT